MADHDLSRAAGHPEDAAEQLNTWSGTVVKGNRGIPQQTAYVVCEDMPRKSLDTRFPDDPLAQVKVTEWDFRLDCYGDFSLLSADFQDPVENLLFFQVFIRQLTLPADKYYFRDYNLKIA